MTGLGLVKSGGQKVQHSLLDPRPEKSLAALCRKHGMRLLCYGTLAGGFLSERWLGARKPQAVDLDVFDLERDKSGRHGRIMRYNLSAN